jgi:hypothetical protein
MVDAPHVSNGHDTQAGSTDIEVVVLKAKHIEHRLAHAFGAHGRGLHEKITSVAQHFSASEVQHFRYVATIRNRMMHDIDYNCLEHRERFLHACAAIDQAIDAILHRREPQRPPERLRTVERLLPEGLRRRIAKVCFFLWSSAS